MLTSHELRKKYLDFFKSKGHAIISSASLIPENDPTVLFNTAGMQPLVPYLLGEKHPAGNRIADVQKCIRTIDIDEVGDLSHLTFFEMLGNWSLGDYFKEETIKWSWEFLTDPAWLGLDPKKLSVTVFGGDERVSDIPQDDEAAEIWKSVGVPENKIAYMPGGALEGDDNWWGPAGQTGPCGPSTEMFYWVGESEYPPEDSNVATDPDNWLEIWNDVFMQFGKKNRTLLIDGMHTLYDEEFKINQELFDVIESFKGNKILVVDGFSDKAREMLGDKGYEVFSFDGEIKKQDPVFFEKLFEKYNLTAKDVLYFDHKEESISSAKKAGIDSCIQYKKDIEEIKDFVGKNLCYFEPLKQKNVDTGMGLDRTIRILNGYKDIFQIDTLWPLVQKVEEISGKKYGEDEEETISMRVIVDHLRAATMIMGDDLGISPSNVDQGYIVRKIIRRAIRHGRKLGIQENFCNEISKKVIEIFEDVYKELGRNKEFVLREMEKEEIKFRSTLEQGIKEFEKLLKGFEIALEKTGNKITEISGKQAFKLYDTYGFPFEMTEELAQENNLTVDKKGFEDAFEKHKALSREGAEQKFKGGLADTGEMSTKFHTATHLLHAALRQVLGDHVAQKGSNITEKRLRFDFSHGDKMNDEEKIEVEKLVNEAIEKDLPVSFEEMTVEEAKEKGAIGLFGDRYGEKVKVYTVGNEDEYFSREICGGPHVDRTGELGKFKIKKEESSSAGVRRIKAILE